MSDQNNNIDHSNHKPSIQMEFFLFDFEIPNNKFLLKQKLNKFGIELNEKDKLFIVDQDGDKIELDENNTAYLSKCTNKMTKFLLIKHEIEKNENKQEILIKNAPHHLHENNYVENHLHSIPVLDELSLTKINRNSMEFCDYEMNKLLEDLPTMENKNFQHFHNITLDNLSLTETIIFSRPETCFQFMLKKYINDFNTIICSTEKNNFHSENEIMRFYDYFEKHEKLSYFLEHFSVEEVKSAKEMILPFHNLLISFNEYKNTKMNELLKSIKNNYEKLKTFEFNIRDEKRKLKSMKEAFETNKSYFNKFMIELQDNIQDLGFNLNNYNFDPTHFDDNLSKLFSFIVKICYEIKSLDNSGNSDKYESLLKSEKYLKSLQSEEKSWKCSKHTFCDQNCPLNQGNKSIKSSDKKLVQLSAINRFMCENIYKGDKLYDV
jgi:hypothetical protein